MHQPSTFRPLHLLRLIAATIVLVLAASACGDDDGGEASPRTAESSGEQGEGLVDNAGRDAITDALGTDGEMDLESAIGSLSPGTRYGIVAGQLDPEPEVQIDGTDIRFVFPSGSVSNAGFDCIIASIPQEVSETLTLVYPDGEKVC